MSRTRRIYNRPNRIFFKWDVTRGWVPLWHPWRVWCCGNPRKVKAYQSRQRRQAGKLETRREIKEASSAYGFRRENRIEIFYEKGD